MKLKVYDAHNCMAVKVPAPPTITVAKKGMITLSKLACEVLEIKVGDRLFFKQDEDRPVDWYIETTNDPKGFELKAKGNTTGLYLLSSMLSMHILNSLQLYETTKFNMAREPLDKSFLFPIITRAARSRGGRPKKTE